MKKGYKRLDFGGFYLVTKGLSKINGIFLVEVDRPGVSWMVSSLTDFFGSMADMIDSMEPHIGKIGQDMFDRFLEQFAGRYFAAADEMREADTVIVTVLREAHCQILTLE